MSTIPAAAREPVDVSWRPPQMATSWRSMGVSAPLEIVRFAAANRLCVALEYRNEQGRQDVRIVEPYSLRRSSAGNLLLMAVRADTGEIRSYRADRIADATATQQSFTPRYVIELTDSGPLSAPAVESKQMVSRTPSWTAKEPARRTVGSFTSKGPTHVFRCTVCGKTFKRQTYDSTLNPHKNKTGQPCYGGYGSFVKTVY